MTDKEKNIDDFIKRNLEIQEPSSDFSNNVMEQILASESKEEKALTALFQKHVLKEPSLDFTRKVMQAVEIKDQKIVYEPVIGKKTWFFIGSLIAIIFVYSFSNLDFSSPTNIYMESFLSKFSGLLSFDFPSFSISPLYAIGAFALGSLLTLDYYLKNRRIIA